MRWKCTCAYDGARFCGWQSQANHLAVQDVLEDQLKFIFKKFIRIHGSSRTDAGVHAKGQVFHFDWDETFKIKPSTIIKAINRVLPPDIHLIKIYSVASNFHARFDAK